MAQKPFLPKALNDRRPWLNNYVDKLPVYATKYSIAPAALTALQNGRLWVNWTLDNLEVPRTDAAMLTAFKNNLFNGDGPLMVPTMTAYSALPGSGGGITIPLVGGVFSLATSTGTQIKAASNYDPADGTDLGLEGTEAHLPDPATTKPDLSGTRPASGGLVEVVWKKGPFSAIRIEVDRGDGKGYVFLAIDTEPNYVDTVKPAPGATALYRYRALYLLGDEDYGQWSDPVEMTVRG